MSLDHPPRNVLFPHVRLEELFAEPVLGADFLDPGYSGHATDVWRVRTPQATLIARIFSGGEWGGPFWTGCRWIFGLRSPDAAATGERNRFLQATGGLPVPRVLRRGRLGELSYLIMEYMPGLALDNFDRLSPRGLELYGVHLASLHARAFPFAGSLSHGSAVPMAGFHPWLGRWMEQLVERFYEDLEDVRGCLPEMLGLARSLPSPARAAPVMVDLGSRQYLCSSEGQLCALVDTDAYVIGPRELDFIALEYQLDGQSAGHFLRGYTSILPLPDLDAVRPLYRYLYRLLEVEGDVPLAQWMAQPVLF